jgi:antirestriction protein ArdC
VVFFGRLGADAMRLALDLPANPEGSGPCASRTGDKRRQSAGKLQHGRTTAQRGSLYEEVTAKIIAQFEAGCFPWVQPWSAAGAVPGLPRNAVTGRAYSGVNVLILWGAVIERAFPSQYWLTFRQALAAGGCVRKGETGETIFYAARFTPNSDKPTETLRGGAVEGQNGATEQPQGIPFLKRFTVFNVAQCDGLPPRIAADPAPLPERQLVADAESLIATSGADFRIGGARAFYSPTEDYVQVPPQPAFTAPIDYYRTALHELGHWTGHPSRLARTYGKRFGDSAYAREELCAELAAAFLCAALGIVPTVRHADYLGPWLAVLREDARAIFKAASHASKAADYLLAFAPDRPAPIGSGT